MTHNRAGQLLSLVGILLQTQQTSWGPSSLAKLAYNYDEVCEICGMVSMVITL